MGSGGIKKSICFIPPANSTLYCSPVATAMTSVQSLLLLLLSPLRHLIETENTGWQHNPSRARRLGILLCPHIEPESPESLAVSSATTSQPCPPCKYIFIPFVRIVFSSSVLCGYHNISVCLSLYLFILLAIGHTMASPFIHTSI